MTQLKAAMEMAGYVARKPNIGMNAGNNSKYKRVMRARLSEQQNHRCCICGKRFSDDVGSEDYATYEHVLRHALYRGRANWTNGVLTCRRCNTLDLAWDIWTKFCEESGLSVDWHLKEKSE